MKIYLAARYSRHKELQGYADQIRQCGCEVTSRWISGSHESSDANLAEVETGTDDELRRFALEDLEDLENADCVICFTEEPRSGHSRGGRHVEFGVALALGKPLAIVGPRENVFHYLPNIDWYPDWQTAMRRVVR